MVLYSVVNCWARPFFVVSYTHTPGETLADPEYAPPASLTLAAASASPEASQPESRNFAKREFILKYKDHPIALHSNSQPHTK